MKKLLLGTLLTVSLLFVSMSGVMAATEAEQAEIDAIYEQMLKLQNQLVDKYASFNYITSEQAELMKEHHMNKFEYRSNNLRPCCAINGEFLAPSGNQNGFNYGYGYGRGGRGMGMHGMGMMGGFYR